jgi:hypothetical protein
MSEPAPTAQAMHEQPLEQPGPEAYGTTPRGLEKEIEPVLCRHCGRTASNGISCEGACVADSGY